MPGKKFWRYPEEWKRFFREYAPGHTIKETAAEATRRFEFEFTPAQVKTYLNNNKIKTGTRPGVMAGQPTKLFPEPVFSYIMDHHEGKLQEELTKEINEEFGTDYTPAQIRSFYKNHKIKTGNGEKAKFKAGHVPANKGKKIENPNPKSLQTCFKVGHVPHNSLVVGEIAEKDGYLWKKVQEGRGRFGWKQLHRIIYEEAHGPIPEGGKIIFLDGDKRNFKIENLKLVTNNELLQMNRDGLFFEGCPELTEAGANLARLRIVTKERQRGKK